MPSLRFENVSKKYRLGTRGSLRHAVSHLWDRVQNGNLQVEGLDYIWALKDVSFEVERGEILGIIGPNGAGKTTALRLFAGITAPTSGSIQSSGRVSALIQLGAGFHQDLTGRENIYLNGSILGLSRRAIDKRFDSIVEFSELEGFIDTPVKRYSSGMYVRLGFAVAAHIEPDILLIDEVLAVGDASFQDKCWRRIRELRAANTTIVLVSHNTWAIRALCDRVLLLWKGEIELEGDPGEVVQEYERRAKSQSASRDEPDRSSLDFWLAPGKAQITELSLLDQEGTPQETFQAGEPMIVRARYAIQDRLENVTFEIAVERSDKIWCWVARTFHDEIDLGALEGAGSFEARIDPLQLMAGMYSVRVQIENVATIPVFAQAWKRFQVVSPIPNPGSVHGVFLPLVTWTCKQEADS